MRWNDPLIGEPRYLADPVTPRQVPIKPSGQYIATGIDDGDTVIVLNQVATEAFARLLRFVPSSRDLISLGFRDVETLASTLREQYP